MHVFLPILTIFRLKASVKTNVTKGIFSIWLTDFFVLFLLIFSKSRFSNLIVGKRGNAII